ncbi:MULTISPECIES: NAD-dependent epimerase/dehydratase family protein [Halolamina]|uniref:Nucleoside-diphosphate-sugar epimerase n=1 Tax=Halolamina pelagica TaxID=699431 RepID=A0A1I5R8E6_9EURY|nr:MULTISPECIES: NAD-dependent epimerase/dehydratase family protein [Halolamina]NHX35736.1 NAD-dependent epimerase/dehydratase family protein [Halolamina sp. R1-12]SFP54789.1 Nucleoside-diphosphate-sugar epimerase [Halolamina pelagica]
MTDTALVVGGTRFVGRHTVSELLDHDYRVTTFTRGESGNPFADDDRVDSVHGDRTDREALETARDAADPDVVIDTCAYHPGDVETATDVFAAADAYVYVSSGSAYDAPDVPMREDGTALHDCTPEQATDDDVESYGPRKAEGDRVVARAAEDGVTAMAVRPMLVYGPHDYTERFAYWTDRVAEYDEVAVPFDGGSLLHRVYVEDVASALRIVAERGEAGEWYNVADRDTFSLSRSLELVADGLNTDVSIVQTGPADLAAAGVEPTDFPLYTPDPALAATEKLAALGWESTDPAEAVATTAQAHREHGRDGVENGPDREAEEKIIDAVRDD